MEWLVQGKAGRMVALFSHPGMRPDLPLTTPFDEGIRGFMQQVGVAWTKGTLRVSDERVASQCLVDALLGARAVRAAGGQVAAERDQETFSSSGEFARWMATGSIRPGEGGTS